MEKILDAYRSEANALRAGFQNDKSAFESAIEPIMQKHITEFRKQNSASGFSIQHLGEKGERQVSNLLESMIAINKHLLGFDSSIPQ